MTDMTPPNARQAVSQVAAPGHTRLLDRLPLLLLTLSASLIASACGDGSSRVVGVDTDMVSETGHIEALEGQDQSGRVDAILPRALIAKVTSAEGAAIPGVSVVWTFSDGGGTATPEDSTEAEAEFTTVTDSRGRAQAFWRLGAVAGEQEATVTLANASSSASSVSGNGKGIGNAKFSSVASAGAADRVVITPSSATLLTGDVQQFSAAVSDHWGNPIEGAKVTWSATPASVLEVDATGRATAMSDGTAKLTAAYDGAKGLASVAVSIPAAPETVGDLHVVDVTETTVTLRWTQVDDGTGAAADYAIRYARAPLVWANAASTQVSEAGTAVGSSRDITFSSLDPATGYEFSIMSYRGTLGSDAVLGAPSEAVPATTDAEKPPVATVIATPGSLDLPGPGATNTLHAQAFNATGSPVSSAFVWQSLDPAIATVDNSGLVTAMAAGETSVIVSAGCCVASDTVAVVVDAPAAAVASVSASPEVVALPSVGSAAQLMAVARDASGNPVTSAFVWKSLDSSIARVEATGRVIGVSGGGTRIVVSAACCAEATDTVDVSVTESSAPPEVTSVTASPETVSLNALGAEADLSAVARDDAGSPVSTSLIWQSLNPAVATVSAGGKVTALSNGTTLVVVSPTCCVAADTVQVSVAQLPQSVSLSPATLNLEVGGSATLSATVRDPKGYTITSPTVTWTSSAASVASVSSAGVVSALTAGSATITARSGTATATVAVSVAVPVVPTPAGVSDLQVIAVSDSSVTLRWTQVNDGTGSPAQYALRYGTPTLSWSAGYATEVSVSGTSIGSARQYTFNGLHAATPYQFRLVSYRGTLGVDAVFGPLSNTVSDATTAPPVSGTPTVDVTPASVTLNALNASATLTAVAKDGTGATVSNPGWTWKSLNTAIVTVSAAGVLTSQGIGTTKVTASAACCGADTVTVTVNQIASSVIVTPGSASGLTPGATQQFSASVRDANGFPIAGASVTWSSSKASVASVNASGLATALASGTANIQATHGGVTGSASLTVSGSTPARARQRSRTASPMESRLRRKTGMGGRAPPPSTCQGSARIPDSSA